MCSLAGPCQADWSEDLGADCPLSGALNCSGQEVYRLSNPSDPKDQHSRRFRNPTKHFEGADECRNRALSVWLSKLRCDKVGSWPWNKKKQTIKVRLIAGSGVYKPHDDDPDHWSYWRCGAYDLGDHTLSVE